MQLPSEDTLRQVMQAPDDLVLVMRGHSLVEGMLVTAIAEAMAAPHELEMKRMPFPLKLDLAIALGILQPRSRGVLMKLNKLRNDFAHDCEACITSSQAQDMKNAFPEHYRQSLAGHLHNDDPARRIVELTLVAAFFEFRTCAENVFHRKLYLEALSEETKEFLSGSETGEPEASEPLDERLKQRIEQKKIQRNGTA